jgi:hypothetical protein
MLIHSGACVINDMLDRDFDHEVGKYSLWWTIYLVLIVSRTY